MLVKIDRPIFLDIWTESIFRLPVKKIEQSNIISS